MFQQRCALLLVFVGIVFVAVAFGSLALAQPPGGTDCVNGNGNITPDRDFESYRKCENLVQCEGLFDCTSQVTGCSPDGPGATRPYRKTEDRWPLGTCGQQHVHDQCVKCPQGYQFVCSKLWAYGSNVGGECFEKCADFWWTSGNGCRPTSWW